MRCYEIFRIEAIGFPTVGLLLCRLEAPQKAAMKIPRCF